MNKNELTSYPLRLPADLKEALEKQAIKFRRSLNAEIIIRLEQGLEVEKTISDEGQVKEKNKIYHVDSNQNKQFNPSVDTETLQLAIELGEKYIASKEEELSIEKRALIFGILYEFVDKNNAVLNIKNETIDKMLELTH